MLRLQLRDADVANAELVEEKRLSRELSAQVQEFIQGRCPSISQKTNKCFCAPVCSASGLQVDPFIELRRHGEAQHAAGGCDHQTWNDFIESIL